MDSASDVGQALLFVDLGSGDGRMVTAVVSHFACQGVGVDVMAESVAQAQTLAAAALPDELLGNVDFVCADMGQVDLAEADVLFLYLPDTMVRQVVGLLLPRSGLRVGAYVVIEDAPEDLRHGAGLRHLLRGGALPRSSRNPSLDLFEWCGSERAGRPTSSPFFAGPAEGPGQAVALQRPRTGRR